MTNRATMLAQLRKTAEAFGARAFGIADLERVRAEPVAALERVPDYCVRAVVAGIRLSDAVLDQIEDQPTPLYFHHYRQANYQLDRMAFALAADLQEGGWRSLAVPASQIVARDPMRGMVWSQRSAGASALRRAHALRFRIDRRRLAGLRSLHRRLRKLSRLSGALSGRRDRGTGRRFRFGGLHP